MTRKILLSSSVVLALLAGSAAAQEAGGLAVSGPGFGQVPMSSLASSMAGGPPVRTPTDVRAANPARAREAREQQAIAAIRGDSGYLAGFHFGQPLAASRQPPPDFGPPPDFTIIEAPFIVNNLGSTVSLAVGNDNTSQQTVAPPPAGPAPTPAPMPAKAASADVASGGLPALAALSAAAAAARPSVTSVDSTVNMAVGTGNRAVQHIDTGR